MILPAPPKHLRRFVPEISRFAVVGGAGYSVDVVLFNVLRALLDVSALPAKLVSLSVATMVAYLGNRRWTYRERTVSGAAHDAGRQLLLFVGWSLGGLVIQVGCLWVSRHVLGFDSLLADNLSGNVIGMALATGFRFWGYRTWVFRAATDTTAVPATVTARAPATATAPLPADVRRDAAPGLR
ncbi:GtrA family protein [Embleya sp. NPDC056575]|uniref:GtrA family protein n=1 Tax=unclassified Embleya TaxID=2699296 RepID=UPI00369DD148